MRPRSDQALELWVRTPLAPQMYTSLFPSSALCSLNSIEPIDRPIYKTHSNKSKMAKFRMLRLMFLTSLFRTLIVNNYFYICVHLKSSLLKDKVGKFLSVFN